MARNQDPHLPFHADDARRDGSIRPTVWPAEPPGPPVAQRVRLDPLEDGSYRIRTSLMHRVELDADFVFRELLEQMPESTEEVVDFVAKWGLPSKVDIRAAPESVLERAFAKREPAIGLDAVRGNLTLLRALSRHLLAHLEGQGEDAVLASWDGLGVDWGAVARKAARIDQAWELWEAYVNRGLKAYAMHVRVFPTIEPRLSTAVPNLFNACCLQLVTYLAEERTVFRCANERCRRPFTRQRGRPVKGPTYGQYRSRGVRYCSHLCAKAQSERDRRRRRAEEAGR